MKHAGSIAARRRGRRSWETRRRTLQHAAEVISRRAENELEKREFGGRDIEAVRSAIADWMVTRTWPNGSVDLSFNDFYREIKAWAEHPDFRERVKQTAFGVLAGHSLSMALVDMLGAGTTIVTPKAEYRLRRDG